MIHIIFEWNVIIKIISFIFLHKIQSEEEATFDYFDSPYVFSIFFGFFFGLKYQENNNIQIEWEENYFLIVIECDNVQSNVTSDFYLFFLLLLCFGLDSKVHELHDFWTESLLKLGKQNLSKL